ncbi:MAG: membrane-associated protease 1 [Oscillospiraceae bacterium]|nr:membrane-associated protease 1 [Oscillospiraceae bacterium]
MEYKVIIDGVAELSAEILEVEFVSKIPDASNARSTDLKVLVTIKGRISFMDGNVAMPNNMRDIAKWSLVKPSLLESYKEVTLEYMHAAVTRKYTLPQAFVISYTESFGKTDGIFTLVLKQKEDQVADVTIE